MKKYLIQATFINAEGDEETCLLRKDGHVVDRIDQLSEADYFGTEAEAKTIAEEWNKENEILEDPLHYVDIEYEATEVMKTRENGTA